MDISTTCKPIKRICLAGFGIYNKKDQRTGRQTIGTVKDLLTNSNFHPHGIKVRLTDGQVGRVQEILTDEK